MENINAVVSGNLRRLRKQKKLSLDALGDCSGVSKSMLRQIERNEANPTLTTLWKIANGLKIPFSELLSRPAAQCDVIHISDVQPLLADNGHYRNYPIFPFDGNRSFEMLYIELDPGCLMKAEAHPEGTQEFITVFSGSLAVEVEGEALVAGERQALRFRADRAHSYQNTGPELCRLSMVILYPGL